MDHYQRLGVTRGCSFQALKQAYRTRAKACHPDRFHNNSSKTAEFQELVRAFNILSDPALRRAYDRTLISQEVIFVSNDAPDLDTEADDILEELIVGNHVPPETSLATLLQDLAKTEVFLTFREGKNLFESGRWIQAEACFRRAMEESPQNILYRVFLARSLARQGAFWTALWHYRFAVRLGEARAPQLHMPKIRQEYAMLFRTHHPFLARVRESFLTTGDPFVEDEADKMARDLSNALSRSLAEERRIDVNKRLH